MRRPCRRGNDQVKLRAIAVAAAVAGAVAVAGGLTLRAHLRSQIETAIVELGATMPAGSEIRHGAVTVGLLGRSASIEDLEIAGASLPFAAFAAERVTFEGAERRDGLLRADRVVVAGLTLADRAGGAARYERLEIDGLEMPLAQPATEAELFGAVSWEQARGDGIEATNAGRFALKAESAVLDSYAGAVLRRMAYRGVSGVDERTGVRLQAAAVEVGPIDFRQLAGTDVPAAAGAGMIEHVLVTGVVVDLPSAGALTLERLAYDATVGADGMPNGVAARIDGMAVPVGLVGSPALHAALRDLGYEVLVCDLGLVIDYDTEARSATVGPLSVALRDGGMIVMGLDLAEVPAPDVLGAGGVAALLPARLGRAEIVYADASLVGRVIDLVALRAGIGREAVIERLVAGATPAEGGPAVQRIAATLSAFLRSPGELSIVASPPEPVALGDALGWWLADPDRAVGALGLAVTSREAPPQEAEEPR